MSDKRDPPLDPDATLSGPLFGPGLKPDSDPDATLSGPLVPPEPKSRPELNAEDPDATISAPLTRPDPDATISEPLRPPPDEALAQAAEVALVPAAGEKLDIDLNFDMDETIDGPMVLVDPGAQPEVAPTGKRRRQNPFAPKALPEGLQANLAALGGLNPLIAFANPIFGVVPEMRSAKTHPDPALLKETLQDLIEAFEAGASAAGVTDESLEAALYALCCLVDDAAAATPWGADWAEHGLLQQMRNENKGGNEFFSLLEELSRNPEDNGDLLEFFYICIALGFEGQFRNAKGGRESLDAVRVKLHVLVERHRPRPVDGLSARWRGVTSAALAASPTPTKEEKKPAWRSVLAPVAALVILLGGYWFMRGSGPQAPGPLPTAPTAEQSAPVAAQPAPAQPTAVPPASSAAPSAAPSASPPSPTAQPAEAKASTASTLRRMLESRIGGDKIMLRDDPSGVTVSIRQERQFTPAGVQPDAAMLPVIEQIAEALNEVPGTIVVVGHTSTLPVKARLFASNDALSLARAEVVAKLIAAKLREPGRVTAEGAGEREQVAPNDTAKNRAKNRRIVIRVLPAAPVKKGAGS